VISLSHYTILSGLLFAIGVYGVLVRRNTIGVLIAIELILNAANINFVAFSRSMAPGELTGQVVALFVIALAAAAAAVGLVLVMAIYRHTQAIATDKLGSMKG